MPVGGFPFSSFICNIIEWLLQRNLIIAILQISQNHAISKYII